MSSPLSTTATSPLAAAVLRAFERHLSNPHCLGHWSPHTRSWHWLSFSDVLEAAIHRASHLQALVAPSTPSTPLVSVIARNSVDVAVADIAAVLAGLPTLPLLPSLSQSDVTHIVRRFQPVLLLCDSETAVVSLRHALSDPEATHTCAPTVMSLKTLGQHAPPSSVALDDVLASAPTPSPLFSVLLTSGSSGPPKGVPWTTAAWEQSTSASHSPSVGLTYQPLAHITDRHALWTNLRNGGQQGILTGVDDSFSEAVAALQPTVFFGTPRMLQYVVSSAREVQAPLGRRCDTVVCGGGTVARADEDALLRSGVGRVVTAYGCTEFGNIALRRTPANDPLPLTFQRHIQYRVSPAPDLLPPDAPLHLPNAVAGVLSARKQLSPNHGSPFLGHVRDAADVRTLLSTLSSPTPTSSASTPTPGRPQQWSDWYDTGDIVVCQPETVVASGSDCGDTYCGGTLAVVGRASSSVKLPNGTWWVPEHVERRVSHGASVLCAGCVAGVVDGVISAVVHPTRDAVRQWVRHDGVDPATLHTDQLVQDSVLRDVRRSQSELPPLHRALRVRVLSSDDPLWNGVFGPAGNVRRAAADVLLHTVFATDTDTDTEIVSDTANPSSHASSAHHATSALLGLWASSTGVSEPSVTSDLGAVTFGDLGGDSLSAVQLCSRLNALTGVQLHPPAVLDLSYDAVARLVVESVQDAGDRDHPPSDFVADDGAAVSDAIAAAKALPVLPSSEPRGVVLTGATGFVGAHVLAELLLKTDVPVTCVAVRSDDTHSARLSLASSLRNLCLHDAARAVSDTTGVNPVTVLCGDVSAPWLGLSEQQFSDVAGSTDVVLHAAAQAHLGLSVSALTAVNVTGSLSAAQLAFAAPSGTRLIHLSSSDVARQTSSSTGYAETKRMAEHVVMAVDSARTAEDGAGARWMLPRLPLVGPSAVTGAANVGDYLSLLLRGAVAAGCVPDGQNPPVAHAVPVDEIARDLVGLVVGRDGDGGGRGRFDVGAEPRSVTWDTVFDALRAAGHRGITRVSQAEFDEAVSVDKRNSLTQLWRGGKAGGRIVEGGAAQQWVSPLTLSAMYLRRRGCGV